ncbi:hypothetical protein GC105_10740 [Alkalibaculum sp. M08DMB]|uniref:Siphovirus-type tail component RIFT-related domain-containing protein n=1 Tax=Alkalibaculum sporogenes TaxID=2655001 RepID=A0A6A7KA08_9FIRM|nr:hypothetical protein [Alkalibaculum sporogenes]
MITLDDTYRFEEDFGLQALIEHQNPIIPEISPKTIKIPSVPGLQDFGVELGTKPFLITLDVIESDPIELQRKLTDFVAFLFDQYGQPRSIKAVLDYEPDKFFMIKVNSTVTPQRMISVSQFTLPFIAYDPLKYSTVYADEIMWGSEVLTFESHYLLGHEGTAGAVNITEPQIIDVTVVGLAVKPVIEITGSATSLVISANSYSITFPTFNNVSWIIDCEKYSVLKNSINAFDEVDLKDFILFRGINHVSITGSEIDVDLRIKYRDKYM